MGNKWLLLFQLSKCPFLYRHKLIRIWKCGSDAMNGKRPQQQPWLLAENDSRKVPWSS